MIEIAGACFPLTFEPPIAGRQMVLLGVVPIGTIDCQGDTWWCWTVDLPLVRKMQRARTREDAHERVRQAVTDWLDAVTARHVARTTPRPQPRARRA